MASNHPPAFATWLLTRLTSDDGVAGDLIEQYRAGRSPFWYWRQVLLTITVHAAADIRMNKLLTIRAALVSCVVLVGWAEATRALYLWVSQKWVYASVNDSPTLLVNWIYYGGHLHLVWCLGAAFSGWLAVRLHRDHPAAATLAGVIGQFPWNLWWGVWWALPLWLRTFEGPHHAWTFPHRVIAASVLIGIPICTVLGSLCAVSAGVGHSQRAIE